MDQKTIQHLVWPPFSLMQHDTSSHRVDQADCGMLSHSSSIAVRSCWILVGTGTHCHTRQFRDSQKCSTGDTSGKLCWPWKNWDIFSFQELCTDPCDMGCAIIMLKHLVMVADEWHNIRISSRYLCIDISIDKMQLCLLSIAYACPYNKPTTTTMGHAVHNVDISKPLAHMTPSARYSWNRDSSVKRALFQHGNGHRMWAVAPHRWANVEVGFNAELQSDPGEDDKHEDEFPWDGFWQFMHSFISCPGSWSHTIRRVKKSDVEVLDWLGYTWSSVVMPVGRTDKFSKTTLEVAYCREINIQFSGNSSGGHSCSQHANCTLSTWDICGIVLCDTTSYFRVAFYCPQHKVHLCNDHAV